MAERCTLFSNSVCLSPIFEALSKEKDGIVTLFRLREVSRDWKNTIDNLLHWRVPEEIEKCIEDACDVTYIQWNAIDDIRKIDSHHLPISQTIVNMLLIAIKIRHSESLAFAFGNNINRIGVFALQKQLMLNFDISSMAEDSELDNRITWCFIRYVGCYDLQEKYKFFTKRIPFFVPYFARIINAQVRERHFPRTSINICYLVLLLLNAGSFGAKAVEYLAIICNHNIDNLKWFIHEALHSEFSIALVRTTELKIFGEVARIIEQLA
ncbi:MAG: hypothetical protein M0R33_13820 [Methylomonas sp.]|jgi:hypothetical protein|uniref:hypothetical protein n=1 Tax=Methylomonas sp. TaxID=418 RepID=UPI0025D74F44|nr:hypothetical protein [Methylomonas sp.]MCK9607513.1 hypothetical protein [Methylomonas sp.]